jgi:hypothetical protein
MTTEPTPPEPKRGVPWFRAGLLPLLGLFVIVLVAPFLCAFRIKTGAGTQTLRATVLPDARMSIVEPIPQGFRKINYPGTTMTYSTLRLGPIVWGINSLPTTTNR